MVKNDGGPAFARPFSMEKYHDGAIDVRIKVELQAGMSLRDWLAGQALAAQGNRGSPLALIAKECYALADAMIAEREKS